MSNAAARKLPDGCDDRERFRARAGAPTVTARGRTPRCVGLLEHCGSGNLGDDATVAAVLQQIKIRWPEAAVIGLSLDPRDSESRHGIRAFAIRQSVFAFRHEWSSRAAAPGSAGLKAKAKAILKKNRHLFAAVKAVNTAAVVRPMKFAREVLFLANAARIARRLDVLIICGGGQLLDWGGPWAFPYTLFKWVLLAKAAGAKCIFLNNGAGPLDRALSRWLVGRSLSLADYVSVRDARSGELVRKIGFRGRAHVVADCAWSLRVPDGRGGSGRKRADGTVAVGIAPMAYCDPSRHWVRDDASYRRFVGRLSEFGARLLRRGHVLHLFSTDIWFDAQAIADVAAAISAQCSASEARRIERRPVTDVADVLRRISQVDCYVTCRYHGVVFSHLLDVPALAIAPHPKVVTLMEEAGLSDYCVDIAECDADRLTTSFERLVADMNNVRGRIRRSVALYKEALAKQFDELFPAGRDDDGEGSERRKSWSMT